MRFLLALLTCTLTLPVAAAPATKTKLKKAPVKASDTRPLDTRSTASRAMASTGSGMSQIKIANPNFGGADVAITPVLGVTVNSMTGMEDLIKEKGAKNYSVSPDTGFSVGALVDVGVGFATTVLETGAAYSQINQKFSVSSKDYAFVLDYVSVPLQAKTYLQGRRTGLFVNYGLLANFLVNATFKGEGGENIQSDMNSMNLVGAAGIGWAMPVNEKSQGVVNLSLARSLTKVNSEGDASLYNNTFLLNVGLML